MATYGKIKEFDPAREDWPQYVERLQFFFFAIKIESNERKHTVLLTVIGAATYNILQSLVSPSKPGNKSYKNLINALTTHFNPTPSFIVQRFKFHTRRRLPGESVSVFISKLRCLSKHCRFGATLEDMLCDRIICGINHPTIQKCLLAEADLDFKKAVRLAQSMGTAAQDAKELLVQKPSETRSQTAAKASAHDVLQMNAQVNAKPPATGSVTCHRCGKVGHIAAHCLFKQAKCHQCGKLGHLRKVCRSKQKSKGQDKRESHPIGIRVVEEADQEYARLYTLYSKGSVPLLLVSMELDSCPILMEVDTGASYSLISQATFKELWPSRVLPPCDIRLCSYSGEPIQVLGCLSVNVTHKSQQSQLSLLVVKGAGPSLLGRDWLKQIQLDWKQINQVSQPQPLQTLLQKHATLFEGGWGH